MAMKTLKLSSQNLSVLCLGIFLGSMTYAVGQPTGANAFVTQANVSQENLSSGGESDATTSPAEATSSRSSSETPSAVPEVSTATPAPTNNAVIEVKKSDAKNANLLMYFTHKDQDEMEELRSLINPLVKTCLKCDVTLVSIAYKGAKIDLKDLQKKMSDVPENTKMVVFDFNLKDSTETKFWGDQIQALQKKGVLVMSATGRAQESEIPMFLNKTVLGQNQKVILIGELSERERMWPLSHFGPEILTALRLPDQFSGQDLAGFYVAMRILPRVQQKSMEDWVTQLSEKKFKTKKIWLDVDEL